MGLAEMTNVPSSYQPLIAQMSSGTGIPSAVIAAQANEESGFDATAVSSAGAEGWLQFEPATYNSVASQAGVAQGTEFNPSDEAKAYVVYMKQLLAEEGGDIRKALAAYNAGPGNLSAGYGYADTILSAAGTGDSKVSASGASTSTPTASTDSFLTNPVGALAGEVSNLLGVSSIKEMFERLGLILFGAALVLLGIHLLAGGNRKQPFNINITEKGNNGGGKSKASSPVGRKTGAGPAVTGGTAGAADSAIEAAAVA